MNQSIDYMRAAVSFAKRACLSFYNVQFSEWIQWQIQGRGQRIPLSPQRDTILSSLHTFPPKSAHVGGRRSPPPQQREILDLARIIARKTLLSSRLEKSLNVKEPLVFVPPIGHDAH